MQQASRTFLFAICALVTIAGHAAADDDNTPGQYAVKRGMQAPAGMFSARVILDLNLSSDHVGDPVSLSPDLYYAISDAFQIGLLHQGPEGWQTRPGTSLCVTGSDNGCPHIYDNVGLDGMFAILYGPNSLSAHMSLFVDSIDAGTFHLALGFAGKTRLVEKVAFVFDPKIAVALNDRDTNHDFLIFPLELEFQLGQRTVGKLLTGLDADLSAFNDTYRIPLGFGVIRNLTPHFDLGGRFSFDNLLGTQPPMVGRLDLRSFVVLLNIRS